MTCVTHHLAQLVSDEGAMSGIGDGSAGYGTQSHPDMGMRSTSNNMVTPGSGHPDMPSRPSADALLVEIEFDPFLRATLHIVIMILHSCTGRSSSIITICRSTMPCYNSSKYPQLNTFPIFKPLSISLLHKSDQTDTKSCNMYNNNAGILYRISSQ